MEYPEHKIHISVSSLIKVIFVCFLFFLIFLLKNLVLVLFMSIVIASAIEPVTTHLIKWKVPRLVAVILIYLFLVLCFVSIVYFLLIPLLSESGEFLNNFSNYFNIKTISQTIAGNDFLSSQPIVESLKNSASLENWIGEINSFIAKLSSNTFNTIISIFGGIVNFFLMIILSFYLSVEEDGVGKFLKIVSPLKHERYILNLWKRSQKKIGAWMQGQLILAIIIGMLVYLGLLLMSMPNALLLATLAAAFEIIPLFGPILASIPAIAIAATNGGFSLVLIVIGLYVIVHQFENQLIYPLVVKKIVGVSPAISIIALVAGSQLGGLLGAILSVPIATIIIEFIEDIERDKIEKMEMMKTNG